MKKKVVLLAISIFSVSMLTACVDQGSVLPASSYVDYSFDEYTLPADEKATEASTAKATEKKTEDKKDKEDKEDKEDTTEAATKKKS